MALQNLMDGLIFISLTFCPSRWKNSYLLNTEAIIVVSSTAARFLPMHALFKHKGHTRNEIQIMREVNHNIPRSQRERIECPLHFLLITFEPPLRSMRDERASDGNQNQCQRENLPKLLNILTPHVPITMNRVSRNAKDTSFLEISPHNRQSTRSDNPRQSHPATSRETKTHKSATQSKGRTNHKPTHRVE